MMNKMASFFKKESVFVIASFLAIISCFFVRPSFLYFNYINWKTLIILFVMMVVVQFLNVLGIFDSLVFRLLNKVRDTRRLVLTLVFVCFFTSIIITNDVALITFVPFSILTLKKADFEDLIIFTVVLQTIAANMGSMLLPIGSPHNIFMYSVSGFSFFGFIGILVPYVVLSFVFLLLLCFKVPVKDIGSFHIDEIYNNKVFLDNSKLNGLKGIFSINDGNNFKEMFFDVFRGVDYFLLFTFIAFFILIGNLENIPLIYRVMEKVVVGNEVICGLLVSQMISNVPAGVLLSGFSNNYVDIIIGINIGGLGSLIASMANLISYKIFVKEYNYLKWNYIKVFTFLNIILLFILLVFYFLFFK